MRDQEKLDTDTSRQRTKNARGDGGNLRQEILDAAVRLLDVSGASELTLRAVAREAGISAPSIYAHFPDVNAMIAEVVRLSWTQLAITIERAAAAEAQKGAIARLEGSMKAYVRFAMERPSRYRILFANELPVDKNGRTNPAERVFLFFGDILSDCEEEGHILPMPGTDASAITIFSFIHGRIAIANVAPQFIWHQMPEISNTMSFFARHFLRHKAEDIVAKLRKVQTLIAQGQPVAGALKSVEITELMYDKWRAEYDGLVDDQTSRLTELQIENVRLRNALSDLMLDNLKLREIFPEK